MTSFSKDMSSPQKNSFKSITREHQWLQLRNTFLTPLVQLPTITTRNRNGWQQVAETAIFSLGTPTMLAKSPLQLRLTPFSLVVSLPSASPKPCRWSTQPVVMDLSWFGLMVQIKHTQINQLRFQSPEMDWRIFQSFKEFQLIKSRYLAKS